jgi:hypothetical protein
MGVVADLLYYCFPNEYQTNEWIKILNPNIKIIIAHSPKDELIPYKHSVLLYNDLRHRKTSQLITITGTHNSMGVTSEYIYTLAELFGR